MAWHVVFGVEVGLEALLSPTHLVLLTGGFLLLTAAARSTWSRTGAGQSDDRLRAEPVSARLRSQLPAVVSLSLATALVAFFLLYASAFTSGAPSMRYGEIPEGAPGHEASELPAVLGLAAFPSPQCSSCCRCWC